jgi:hypothetical protein
MAASTSEMGKKTVPMRFMPVKILRAHSVDLLYPCSANSNHKVRLQSR